jgi:uncharacterized membrane protein YphA (DoxX/SURF4 family)
VTSAPDQTANRAGPKLLARRFQPWISLLVRLGLAAITAAAAIPKLTDLRASRISVAAYELFPPAINKLIGVGLPIVELTLALLFLAGLLTRYASAIFGLMLIAFMAGIASAWARGLNINCGCFSSGGELAPGEQAQYGLEILRDCGFLVMVVFLVIWPRSVASLDTLLGLNPRARTTSDANPTADTTAAGLTPGTENQAVPKPTRNQAEAAATEVVDGIGQHSETDRKD